MFSSPRHSSREHAPCGNRFSRRCTQINADKTNSKTLCSICLLSACILVHLRLKIIPVVMMGGMIPLRIALVALVSVALAFGVMGCTSNGSNQRPIPATAPGDRSAPFDAYQAMADAL